MLGTIDLRSDTFTVPDAGMREAMAQAEVGDDVWDEDPTVHALQTEVARLLGKEASLLFPSGTMANLCAVVAQTSPGDEVILDQEAHIAYYEVAGAAVVGGVQFRTLDATDGIPSADAVTALVRTEDIHFPVSRLLCLENTHNRRGGAAAEATAVAAAAGAAHAKGLRVHCDGARLFNAAAALEVPAAELVARCDSVMVSLSKGLGAPVGSMVAADALTIAAARRWRKRLGGGMRQAGILAAAGLYALRHNMDRLRADQEHAAQIAAALCSAGAEVLLPAHPTNMVMVRTRDAANAMAARCAEQGVKVSVMGEHLVRCVLHGDIDSAMAERAAAVTASAV